VDWIEENLREVRERIERAAASVGRDPDAIKLVAVSKGRPVELIRRAMAAGQKAFGENRAQELREKLPLVEGDPEWHFIGHLQRNKVNIVVGKVVLIHSVDSTRLAEAIARRARTLGTVQEVLLQVNVSGEETKYGVGVEGVRDLLEKALELRGLKVRGLMTIAPLDPDPSTARRCFSRLRELRDRLAEEYPEADLGLLSMGMTQDFEAAVQEGADVLRIGTAVFTPRGEEKDDRTGKYFSR
jgi:hypothetical protein